MSTVRRGGRPRSSVPANYSRLRLPRQTIIARFAEGDRLRREGRRDAADGSVYEQRGLREV